MEIKVSELNEKHKELLNKAVSVWGFSTEPTFGPKMDIDGRKWFYLKDGDSKFLCVANEKALKKGFAKGHVRREAGIPYLEV